MAIGEPQHWTAARKARLAQRYPQQFGSSDAKSVIGTDAYTIAQGGNASEFDVTAMGLASHAGSSGK